MPWMIPAAIAGGAVISGVMGSNAADKASDAQGKASAGSIAEQRRQFDLTRADNSQFQKTGTAANRRLAQLLGVSSGIDETDPRYRAIYDPMVSAFDQAHQAEYNGRSIWDPTADATQRDRQLEGYKQQAKDQFTQQYGDPSLAGGDTGSLLKKFGVEDLNADPVYQSGLKFGLDTGVEGINSRATANGMYDSGATLKALTRFGNDYGSTKANESFNRYNTANDSIFNRLSGVSGSGQVATGQVASAGANTANSVGASMEGAGNARAAGIVGGANAWGGALTGGVNAATNYSNNQRLMALLSKRGGGGGSPYGSNSSDFGYYDF